MDLVNIVLTFGPASLVAYSIGSRLVSGYRASRAAEIERPARERPALPTHRMLRPMARTAPVRAREPEPRRSRDFPLLNGAEPQSIGSVNPLDLVLNADEVIAVARMIDHNRTAAKPSKSSTIQAGFGVSRGGSAAYTRASLIYDTLFGPPAPAVKYRELTPEQEHVRAQLMRQKGALN